jgi:hypothetical protein
LRVRRNLATLLRSGNSVSNPCFGTAHFHLRPFRGGRRFYVTAPGHILEKQIFKPGRITQQYRLAFLQRLFQMIIEVATVIFLIQIASLISRLIGRQRDVFHYVSRPDTR